MPSRYVSRKYLSFIELRSKLGGRGRTTIYRDVELGRLPKPVKIGSRLYWNEADVDAAISGQTA
ncbi:transcriptional regulator [Meridianimarinicoccus roseus]|uniref:Transcriptional regulator n=1 Tax=Meridianimarinicoccus roseus TaxID=2072018 RepID=A0A2V2LMX2_9RHOB|nr:transcriptional regulator [Meridianimarinicoccus roseus]